METWKQEIIDKIDSDFKGQASENQECRYLTSDGKKCVVGLFIPDGHEVQDSRADVVEIVQRFPDLLDNFPTKDLDFWDNFQAQHDGLIEDTLENQKNILKKYVREY